MRIKVNGSAAAIVMVASTVRPANGQGDLDDLLDAYEQLQQITLTASVHANFADKEAIDTCCIALATYSDEDMEGWFSYTADGDKWRMDNYMEPGSGAGMDTTILFDNTQFAYIAHNSGVLSIDTGGVPAALGMMLLNPIVEPLQFLFPLDDANEGTQPQLSDARSMAQSTTIGSVQWTPVLIEGKTLDRADFPGAVYNGVAYTHHVYTKPGAHDQPVIIDRVNAQGDVVTRTRLSHYTTAMSANGSESAWPRNVVWQAYEPAGDFVVLEISMVIEDFTVNQPAAIPAGAFDIDAIEAEVVVVDGVIQQQ